MNHVEKIIFTRPSVTVDEDLGYLPGTLEEKEIEEEIVREKEEVEQK